MSPLRVALAFAVAVGAGASVGLVVPPLACAQDFDPHGRHRPHPAAPTRPPPPRDSTSPAEAKPEGPPQGALIERYARIVLSQPGAAFPLQRLAQLYRDRDGNLARLLADFEAKSKTPGNDQFAATVALGGIYKLDGRIDDSVAAYDAATRLKRDDPTPLLALAHLLEDRGDLAPARARYEQALPLQTVAADKEQTLRALMGLALGAQDWAAAQGFHRELVKLEPTSLFVRGELGRELFARGEYARAEVELREVVAAAAGDNRALAPALKELGRAQAKAHESADAIATLKRALQAAGDQAALRAEIYSTIAEIYRADQRLPALIQQLEAEHPGDSGRLALLGGLYEEVGESAKAIDTYRRALATSPRQVDIRLRMIRLLEANGDLDRAIAEYDALIRAAPNNPQFVFEECQALLQRGDHARALKLASELEARSAGDEEILTRVAEFYARVGESERSLHVLQRLASGAGANDPGHLVDLGDRYYQDGNVALAVQTWRRILGVVQPRAKALAALGDVYLEHDMGGDAVAALREASQLDPGNVAVRKSLAAALERTHAYHDARAIYEEIVAKATASGDRALARECRTRIVTLWGLERVLEQQVAPLEHAFATAPPDVEAGRTLAEALVHMRRLPEAEAALRRVVRLSPGDTEAYAALERVLVQENRLADAIAVLEHLAQLEPKRARELYERMAQYALQIYRDDDAIRYAARAVELNPDDAEGHRRLGEMYRSRQDTEHAIAEFRAAIAKNDRLFVVYFELADLLLSKGNSEEADRLFRGVVRGAPDEELVARAARLSMQINLGRGTLESLEQDLLPLAIGNPQRPLYRRLLVEIYGSLTFGLVQRVRHGTPSDAERARGALARVGARAVKPLLDGLADPDVSQQRIAIDVLAYVQNRNAAAPLFAYATGPAELPLRTRAMLACGALAEPSLVPKYDALLFPRDKVAEAAVSDPVGVAAVWGLARIGDARALPVLRKVAASAPPAMRALALIGLGLARDAASTPLAASISRSVDAGTVAQAAAAYALGDLNAQAEAPRLIEIAADGEPLARQMALLALARMAVATSSDPPWRAQAARAMAEAVFDRRVEDGGPGTNAGAVARAGVSALAALTTRGTGASAWAKSQETLVAPDGPIDVEQLLAGLAPPEVTPDDRAAALVEFAGPIRLAAEAALQTSAQRAAAVLDALGDGAGELLPFVGPRASGRAATIAREITDALEPALVPLARHPDPAIRTKAIVLATRSSSEEAAAAVVAGLEDPSEDVRRVALSAVGSSGTPGARSAMSEQAATASERILTSDTNWAIRVLAARALGRLGASGLARASAPLQLAAEHDSYALVRQAALEALASFDASGAAAVAARMAETDPEPRVRETAKALAR